MENATKALMIAGAVLLVILIIGVGMAIFGGGQKIIETGMGSLGKQEIQMINSQFDSYEGKQSGSQVKALITAISQHNANAETNGVLEEQQITINDKNQPAELAGIRAQVVSGKMYNVSIDEYYSSGIIKKMSYALAGTGNTTTPK